MPYIGRDEILVVVADLEVAAEEGHEVVDLGASVSRVSVILDGSRHVV